MEYTAKLTDKKVQRIEYLKNCFTEAKDTIFVDYRGVNVKQLTDLRRELSEKHAKIRIMKNNYTKIAINELGYDAHVETFLTGPTAIVFAFDESGPVAKVLVDASKNISLDMKGALIAGKIYTDADIIAYSKLPTRHELLATIAGTVNAPTRGIAVSMKEVIAQMARAIQAVAEKK